MSAGTVVNLSQEKENQPTVPWVSWLTEHSPGPHPFEQRQ